MFILSHLRRCMTYEMSYFVDVTIYSTTKYNVIYHSSFVIVQQKALCFPVVLLFSKESNDTSEV